MKRSKAIVAGAGADKRKNSLFVIVTDLKTSLRNYVRVKDFLTATRTDHHECNDLQRSNTAHKQALLSATISVVKLSFALETTVSFQFL